MVTVALNCCVPLTGSAADPGEMLTPTGGISVIAAVRAAEDAPSVLAVTVTLCCVSMLAGAVYSPVELSVPGLPAGIDHTVSSALHIPVARTVNCWACEPYNVTDDGFMIAPDPASEVSVKKVDGELWLLYSD